MSHLKLAQTFSKLLINKEVWVYDKGELIKGSPFSNNTEISSIIGIDRASKVVQRYIDTGKTY